MKPLWSHQVQAIEKALASPHFFFFHEMGCGKTRSTIEVLRHRCNERKKILRTLILCPLIVTENWRREILAYSKIPPERVHVLTGPGAKRLHAIAQHGYKDGQAQGGILITNYEALVSIKGLFEALFAWQPEKLILDECHRIKDPSAKRTKALIKLSDAMPSNSYRLGLTGTPVLNSEMDLFSQFRVVDQGTTFGKNFFAFRSTYFWDKNGNMPRERYFPNWLPRSDSKDRLGKAIAAISDQVKKEACLDLPPLVRQEIDVELGKEQAKAYEEMKKDLITFIQDKACVAQLAITKALRLQQILSGHLKMEDGEVITFKDNPRSKVLEELLGDITPNHKVIVWAVFKEDFKTIRAVCEKLKVQAVELHGEVSSTDKFANMDAFNTDPNIRVLIGHPGSGIGVNLVSASYSIWYSRNFSLEQDLQANARNHRPGAEIHEKITRIDLVARKTLDEVALQALIHKQNLGDRILEIAKEI